MKVRPPSVAASKCTAPGAPREYSRHNQDSQRDHGVRKFCPRLLVRLSHLDAHDLAGVPVPPLSDVKQRVCERKS
jgi:hypothetical protein